MPSFIVLAALLTGVALAALAWSLRSGHRPTADRAALNADALRRLLAELERDRAAGLLSETDYAAARADLERRVLQDLACDVPSDAAPAAPGASAAAASSARPAFAPRAARRAVLASAVALPVAAAALYGVFGSPDALREPGTASVMSDLTAGAPADADGSPVPGAQTLDALLRQLEARVAREPKDGRAWVLLGRVRMETGAFAEAATAYQRALELPKVARDPLIWCELADALAMQQGGVLAGKPRELIDQALALDPQHLRALEMAGSAAYEAKDFRAAHRHWSQLLAQLPEISTEHQQVKAAVERVARLAPVALPSS